MSVKALVAASTQNRRKAIASVLQSFHLKVKTTSEPLAAKALSACKLLVCELGPRMQRPDPYLESLPPQAHVVLVPPKLDIRWVTFFLQDPRINHFLSGPADLDTLKVIIQRLATGEIFGLDCFLPTPATIEYRRIASYRDRCETMEALDAFCREQKLRGSLVRSASRVLEELLMNAMYQAPMDPEGNRLFAEIEPRRRIRKKTPRAVSVRYALHQGKLFLSVRDRFGSFRREDLARYLLRCTTSEIQMEKKKLGAGLGLYLVASSVSALIINILPGVVSEFICVLEPSREEFPLRLLSICTQHRSEELPTHRR